MLEDPISHALFSGRQAAGAALVAPEADAPPVAVFSSRWGDGLYPTWLGHAKFPGREVERSGRRLALPGKFVEGVTRVRQEPG